MPVLGIASYEPTYRIVCLCQFVYFLGQYILNYGSLVIFTVAIFFKFKMAARYHWPVA